MSSSSTMTTSILPITRKGSDAAGGEIRQKTRQQKSMTSQGLMQLPTSHQPSRAAVFQSLFLTHFIEFYRNSKTDTKRISWVHQVPQFVANSPSLAVKYCIRATSMAIYGQLTDDKSIQSDSCRWYTFGSGHQRNNIRRMIAAAATCTREGGGATLLPRMMMSPSSLPLYCLSTLRFVCPRGSSREFDNKDWSSCMPHTSDAWDIP